MEKKVSRPRRRKRQSIAAAVQLSLFTDEQLMAMEERREPVKVDNPIRDLFILPWLRGKSFRDHKAALTVNAGKRVVTDKGLQKRVVCELLSG